MMVCLVDIHIHMKAYVNVIVGLYYFHTLGNIIIVAVGFKLLP
jgi:hypothetical protein